MAPYLSAPLDFNADPTADTVADGPGFPRDTDPPPLDTESLLDEIGLSGQAVREVLDHAAPDGFGGMRGKEGLEKVRRDGVERVRSGSSTLCH